MRCSVIVTTLGGPHLDRQLASLAAQTTPPEQVVVVNNGRAGSVDEVWRRWQGLLPSARLVEDDRTARCGYARNRGAEVATEPGLLFLDDDDEVDARYVAEMRSALDTADLVGARTELLRLNPVPLARAWGRMQHDHLMSQHGFLPWCVGGAMGVRREAFTAVGGFDESLAACEDTDLCWRAQLDAGARLAFHPSAIVHYRLRRSPLGAFRQARAWGTAESLLHARYPASTVPPAPGRDLRLRTVARHVKILLASRDPYRAVVAARLAGHRVGVWQGRRAYVTHGR